MNSNRVYSKNFGKVLMVLGLAIFAFFGSHLLNISLWGIASPTYLPFTVLVAFSSVATFFTGAAFYRGVFLMSEHVIKPKAAADQATPNAAA
ncbi:hypothetical protein V0M98_37035 (plasmid) [Pseudomonas silesiensis]|uniref:hypothetical protein n=1 Tax=Pseudomonas silesiensis TaxID=1853130 RepID=UPI0030D10C62